MKWYRHDPWLSLLQIIMCLAVGSGSLCAIAIIVLTAAFWVPLAVLVSFGAFICFELGWLEDEAKRGTGEVE
jgi:hypothetical protein